MSPFLSAYFSRLGWTGTPDVSLHTLRELHIHHNGAIPFENLDVLLPREIHLDDRTLEEKLIHGRRGGYCFEQNGLLERALREIGFPCAAFWGAWCWPIRRICRRVPIGCCWWRWRGNAGLPTLVSAARP
ncbi:N-hydroxyarylamine O-acetyltransferase [Klebsiella michiganensis]|uniref:N-hydroxyarylamine O-acetyltransferase n=1 Tax=Klebsiella michiganensis TaxID=1134687 RepID=A0A7H4LT83_9ENTR|nr:N-hydroxyarylamine O-acetyltransferase [Klebsiella michiganensis]